MEKTYQEKQRTQEELRLEAQKHSQKSLKS